MGVKKGMMKRDRTGKRVRKNDGNGEEEGNGEDKGMGIHKGVVYGKRTR